MSAEPRFFNRELSWLEFNQRVLDEARNEANPLLERLKFLAITASNLDEFASVRVGGLKLLCERGASRPDPSGMTPEQQLAAVCARMHAFIVEQYRCLLDELEPALSEAGIRRLRPADLSDRQRKIAELVFEQEVFPILTPIAVPTAQDFPPLINQTFNVCVRLAPAPETAEPRFAVIPFGRQRKRFITVPVEQGYGYCPLEDLVGMSVQRFFPGETIEECISFRITRNADLELREELTSDILEEMKEVLAARKESECVRLEISDAASEAVREFLQTALELDDDSVYAIPGPLDLAAFMRLTDSQGFDHLKFELWPPIPSPQLDPAESLFTAIARRDVLLYHPYESFEPVVRLLEEAADDPEVLAIKQTLYRTSPRSPIIAALKRAAQNGKYVTALVELKARFDEARNIEWATDLERSDVQVIYGVKGLKTHAKICIIVRREPTGIQRYVHFGTGNYNEITSRFYTDASLMTCDEELGADATTFFNAITGYSQPQRFRKLEAAPLGMRDKLLEMIEAEIIRKKHGQRALIMAKFNALSDEKMIEALYAASNEGVKIRLNIRGVCCLRPGVPGLSENITVTSVVDRFLEHSRIVYFHHGGDQRLFISSADWMSRNLDRRVELLVPVEQPQARDRLLAVLKTSLQDDVKARRLLPDGRYESVSRNPRSEPVRSQEALYRRYRDAAEDRARPEFTMFEPHRAPGQDDD